MAELNYIQQKAAYWREIKEIEVQPTIDWSTATLDDLEGHLKKLKNGDAEPVFKGDYCKAECHPETRRYVRLYDKWGWQLRPFGTKGIPHYVQGPLITFCPFCGRRLRDG